MILPDGKSTRLLTSISYRVGSKIQAEGYKGNGEETSQSSGTSNTARLCKAQKVLPCRM